MKTKLKLPDEGDRRQPDKKVKNDIHNAISIDLHNDKRWTPLGTLETLTQTLRTMQVPSPVQKACTGTQLKTETKNEASPHATMIQSMILTNLMKTGVTKTRL